MLRIQTVQFELSPAVHLLDSHAQKVNKHYVDCVYQNCVEKGGLNRFADRDLLLMVQFNFCQAAIFS